jgi:hypothetical protein
MINFFKLSGRIFLLILIRNAIVKNPFSDAVHNPFCNVDPLH